MYVQVTEAHIRLGQSYPAGMTRGASCPIAWAIRDALGPDKVRMVYVGPATVEVYWSSGSSGWGYYNAGMTTYNLDKVGYDLIDEADAKGEGRTDIAPRVVRLDSHPLPVVYKTQVLDPKLDVNEEVGHE